MAEKDGSQFLGYVAAGSIITPELMVELMQGRGARQPFDLELKPNPDNILEIQANAVPKG